MSIMEQWYGISLSHAAFLGGISAEDCEIRPHNSDLYTFLDK
jgi:hypothetical protein